MFSPLFNTPTQHIGPKKKSKQSFILINLLLLFGFFRLLQSNVARGKLTVMCKDHLSHGMEGINRIFFVRNGLMCYWEIIIKSKVNDAVARCLVRTERSGFEPWTGRYMCCVLTQEIISSVHLSTQ